MKNFKKFFKNNEKQSFYRSKTKKINLHTFFTNKLVILAWIPPKNAWIRSQIRRKLFNCSPSPLLLLLRADSQMNKKKNDFCI